MFIFGVAVAAVAVVVVGVVVGRVAGVGVSAVAVTEAVTEVGIGVGVVVAGVGVGVTEVGIAVAVGVVVVVVGVAVGVVPILIFIISLIKIFFTLKNIFYSFKQIPYNWSKLIIYQDIYFHAEIIPGINKFNGMEYLKFSHLKNIMSFKYDISDKILITMYLLILYIPIIIYRISLKSTSLFYWILFIYPMQDSKKYNNKKMKNIILNEQKIYFYFPLIMIVLYSAINIDFSSLNIIAKYIEQLPFYFYLKHFLSYFIVSAILYGVIWIIAKGLLISDENSDGFYRKIIDVLHICLKLSISIGILFYFFYLYNHFNISDVVKDIFTSFASFEIATYTN
jgi:hypothetical protein